LKNLLVITLFSPVSFCIKLNNYLGSVDCMDWSDEKMRYTNGIDCPFQALSYDCDEHICERDTWSCGDGQCLRWTTRLPFQTIYPQSDDCISKRNLNHICELSMKHRLWTLPNGMCSIYAGSDDSSLDMVNPKLSDDDRCEYLIRCALSAGFERDCPCNHLNCFKIMTVYWNILQPANSKTMG
jgi:hypothetical protein